MQGQETSCTGCRRSFQEGETLPPEGIHIEYKNYYLPIKDHQPKWILMKTIIAFLNSKGGTIFMGVDDSTRQVIGVTAQLKEQDMFMLQFDQLLDNVQPQVDLRHKQQVRVKFVPVLKDKTFQGKYIIKIIVKQGDPSKVYHFAQTLKFFNQDKKHHDEQFKVLWGFYRSNMGKVDSIKGTQLLREVYQKAKNPSITVETFHPGCNPEPLQVSVRNMNIGFKNLKDPKLKDKILQFIQKKLKTLHLQTSYTVQKAIDDADTVVLKFKSITQYKQADAYILQNQRQLSDMIQGDDSLLDQGFIDNTHFYKIGQSFNPSLRYLRNRSRSRNRSIQITDKQGFHNHHQSPPNSNGGARTTHQTHFKPKQSVKPETNLVKKQFKNNQQPQQEQIEQQENQDQQQGEQKQVSPAKKFVLKPEQFPSIQKVDASKSNQKIPQTNIKVHAPKTKLVKQVKQQSPIKESLANTKDNLKEKQDYHISIGNIYQKSFEKVVNYFQHSLTGKMEKIPKKIEEVPSNEEIVIHFPSLRDIQNFIQQLSQNIHHRQILNGFGNGRIVNITVRKGSKLQDFKWISQVKNAKQQKNQGSKQQKQKDHSQSISPKKEVSPAGSFVQKNKLKSQDIKGCPFLISNLKLDLNDLEKRHFAELLRQIFKHFCSQNSKVQIVNENTLIGVVELRFQSDEQRKKFADQMQTEIIKYHEFTDFFKGFKAYWGVPSGNIIIHHYRSEDKKIFKEQLQKLFVQNKQISFATSRYVKDKDSKYYLCMNFHINNLVKGLQIIYQNVDKSPIKDYGSKEGIVVTAQINRI